MPSKQVTIIGVMTWEDATVGTPPGIWGGNDPFPTPPIHLPGPGTPPGIWGGAPLPWPTPPIHFPPGVNVPTFPTHPIAPGGPPPGIWGGSGQPFPGYGLPGVPPGIWGGANQPFPGYGLPGVPPGFWGGGNVPMPTPPIHLPPPSAPGTPGAPSGGAGVTNPIGGVQGPGGLVWYWSPVYGWFAKLPEPVDPNARPDHTLPGDLPHAEHLPTVPSVDNTLPGAQPAPKK